MAKAPQLEWQGSLFGGDTATPDPTFSTLARRALAHGAWVDHVPGWLAGSDDVFQVLLHEHTGWSQPDVKMYDATLRQPRLSGRWRDDPALQAKLPVVDEMRRLLSSRYDVDFDSVGLNLYRDGQDSVAWHGDRILRTSEQDSHVAIVSLGSTRRFLLRPKSGGPSVRYDVAPGDLLVMGGSAQRTWQHCVPKVASAGPRISVTFRHKPAESAADADDGS